jgi:ABC-type glycerol-3-phosphate transport system substrate-binding protein
MKPFQVILLVIFASLAMLAVFIFATFSGAGSTSVGKVTVWGSISKQVMDEVISETRLENNAVEDVDYVFVPEASLSTALIEAIAGGRGPDLVLLPASALVMQRETLLPISYSSISRRDFQDTYVEAGELFLSDAGIYGLPFYIDPYVTYWNRTLFSQGGIARAPRYWDEFIEIAPRLTNATEAGTLTQSAVALGEWDNVRGAKDILLSLIKGFGNSVTAYNNSGELTITLLDRASGGTAPTESALRFYSEFADPVQTVYSWNRSQADSRDAFTAGLLAVYLGRASEVATIRAANPNLNFDVAHYPQPRDGLLTVPVRLYAFSIPRGSQNPTGALQAAAILTSSTAQQVLTVETGLPSVRRDMLTQNPDNPYESLFKEAALNSFSFIDPDPQATDAIFKRMVENVSSGRLRFTEAVRSAQTELEILIGTVQ